MPVELCGAVHGETGRTCTKQVDKITDSHTTHRSEVYTDPLRPYMGVDTLHWETEGVAKPDSGKRPVPGKAAAIANAVKRPTRTEDPETSHDAAVTTIDILREDRQEVLALFIAHGPMMDEQMLERAAAAGSRQTDSGLRTRRSELVEANVLWWSGDYGQSSKDRRSRIWTSTPPDGDRDGDTYVHEFDYERLNAQARRVYDCIKEGGWWSLAEISAATGDPEASISARLRDFRKPEFGGLDVPTRRRGGAADGVWESSLAPVLEVTDLG